MDKKQKKKSSKNEKPAKKRVDEKPVKSIPKAEKPSTDLPAVQCKDTLLLDYEYNKQFSKRSLVSNWDKYNETPDEDDENGQLSAGDFEQLLSASKSIGDHFTFAAERSWLQNDTTDESSMASDLFKLNISNLKKGISCLPFYLRQDLSKDLLTSDEITMMDTDIKIKQSASNQANQNLLNLLNSDSNNSKVGVNKNATTAKIDAVFKKSSAKSPTEDDLVMSLKKTKMNDQTSIKLTPTSSNHNPFKPLVSDSSTVKSVNTEDIQDWLDDILNES